jgi:hypothetical protein
MSASYFSGSNPNISPPTDRPQTLGVRYIASVDNSQWIWNGLVYVPVPQQGSSSYHIYTTTDIVSDGLTTMPVNELSIWVPYGLTVLKVTYFLKVSTSNNSYGSSVSFPQSSVVQISGGKYNYNNVINTSSGTMIVDVLVVNPAGSTQDWFWPVDFVPDPIFTSTPRTLTAGSAAVYTLFY